MTRPARRHSRWRSGCACSPGSTCCSPAGACRCARRTTRRREISEGTGEIGFFSPHSWWPLWVGLAAAVTAVGFAIGWWLVLIGFVALLFTSIGFVFEYYRGHFAH